MRTLGSFFIAQNRRLFPGAIAPLRRHWERVVKILGIDPGLTGALAVVETINGVPTLVDATDMPITGTGAKARLDVIATAAWIANHAPSMAYIERAQAFPGQGRSSTFVYGRVAGAVEAAVSLCRIPMTLVEAAGWKRELRLPGKNKEAARQRALQLFPQQHALFARKRDHNRAEAALIAVAACHV
jgi:crossover junction endodeoxyribonuclease RuvC